MTVDIYRLLITYKIIIKNTCIVVLAFNYIVTNFIACPFNIHLSILFHLAGVSATWGPNLIFTGLLLWRIIALYFFIHTLPEPVNPICSQVTFPSGHTLTTCVPGQLKGAGARPIHIHICCALFNIDTMLCTKVVWCTCKGEGLRACVL